MTLVEEQLCDWTFMANAFLPRARGRLHMSVYLQPVEFSKNIFSLTCCWQVVKPRFLPSVLVSFHLES